MRTVELGNTGQQVSNLCLGTMYFGSKNDEATSYQLLDQYVDAGGTFLTAPMRKKVKQIVPCNFKVITGS